MTIRQITSTTGPASRQLRVTAGFPGVGKSTLFRNQQIPGQIVDSDSSTFPKDSFPANYIAHIQRCVNDRKLVLCSTHDVVRDALVNAGLPFVLVYPRRALRDEYLNRYQRRGSPQPFLDLMNREWDNFVSGCEAQKFCTHVVLEAGEFMPATVEQLLLRANSAEQLIKADARVVWRL